MYYIIEQSSSYGSMQRTQDDLAPSTSNVIGLKVYTERCDRDGVLQQTVFWKISGRVVFVDRHDFVAEKVTPSDLSSVVNFIH